MHLRDIDNPNTLDDRQLWDNFKSGNSEALSTIFLQHFDLLLSYTTRLTNDTDETKDLIQELFLKLWKNRNNLGDCNSIKYYLLRSMRSLVIDQKKKSAKIITTQINETNIPFELSFESIIIQNQTESERLEKVDKALESLSKRQQEAIFLRYYEQIEYPEISEIMTLNIQSVRNLIHSGIQVLRDQLS